MYYDRSAVRRVLDEARKKLLDTGTRNRLVHVNRENKRANALNIVNEVSDEIFRQLRLDGRRMRCCSMRQTHLSGNGRSTSKRTKRITSEVLQI